MDNVNPEHRNISYNAQGELTIDNDYINIGHNNDSELIDIESIDTKSTDINYAKYKGKVVVLVDSNNPWYMNTDNTIPLQYTNTNPIKYSDSSIENKEDIAHAKYEHFKNSNENLNENENTDIKNNAQTIILILLFIVFVLIIYKFYIKDDCSY
ncbi:hypothetical protein BMW23_0316 [Bodo saltans virus]|uniref:Transmembrane protein n=1 Tax=Bodo saltans virus TaxID=2024608 RepID=A0A2H4UU27_9VIRU|nr:hypothetical protein QJ851_gp0311 [Bodo saltans virus]ATZ80374.1 hypothetical protein BMW23_0316 [Bodo saltans virus]